MVVSESPKNYITIKKYPIRLGQFLKVASLVSDGVEAKHLIGSGFVLVNGSVEYRRGRQLISGDIVSFDSQEYVCD